MKPTTIQLTEAEATAYRSLRPEIGAAFRFWKAVCKRLKIELAGNSRTVVSIEGWGTNGDFRATYSPRKIPVKGRAA